MDAFDATHTARLLNLYASATLEVERLVITQEFLDAQLERADEVQGQMRSTLEARGIDTSSMPDVMTSAPEIQQTIDTASDSRPVVTPGTLQPSRVAVTPAGTEAPAVANSPLTNIVMARSVTSDDCAQEVTSQFTDQDTQIYIVATANNLSIGTTVSSRWLRDGQELTTFEITFDFDIREACIWFFADQTDFTFTPGNYTVELYAVGNLAGSANFTITSAG